MEFTPFPKISRWSREVVITEKLDGTNAQILIQQAVKLPEGHVDWPYKPEPKAIAYFYAEDGSCWNVFAGSRTRWITPEDDNFGFAKWVVANLKELKKLGPGNHFGEWWGHGIQRGYGLKEKKFSLFNTGRWNAQNIPACCNVVPQIYSGPLLESTITDAMTCLRDIGSFAAPNYFNPEGIVIYHTHARTYFKKTFEKDQEGKGN